MRREGGDELQTVADWCWDQPGQPFTQWKEEPMRLYRVISGADDTGANATYAGTMKDAQEKAKATPKALWSGVQVDEVEVPTDKAGLIAFLNGAEPEAVKTYELTNRGALKEAA